MGCSRRSKPSSCDRRLKHTRPSNELLVGADLQGKLHPAIADGSAMLREATRLAQLAKLFEVPIWATEHCPDRIGPLVPALVTPAFRNALPPERTDIVICCYQAHICVMQTARS